jgi:DNA repair protein RadA/Sms
MTREKSIYVCQHCGAQQPRWMGRCPDCGEWNSLVEERPSTRSSGGSSIASAGPVALTAVAGADVDRYWTGISEFDRVLGGGLVIGSLVLIGGDPGIGKSTLLLQASDLLARNGKIVLYSSGEESARQIKMRADRLGVGSDGVFILAENSMERILDAVASVKPHVVVVDSIQSVYTEAVEATPGSLSQIRETAARFMTLAKGQGIPVFLVGHVTKEGFLAGPKALEHMVDTVLYFEGERGQSFRILRAVKNRYGSTNEIAVFEMKDAGLAEVTNPSELFLSQRGARASGSVVVPCMEGSRPILVELQALVSPSSFGMPRRTCVGVDPNRVALLAAVLEKRVGYNMSGHDLYLNVAGGVSVDEPAVDLGVVVALVSSLQDHPLDPGLVIFGEVGLSGEIRGTSQGDLRIREAAKMGFSTCLLPAKSALNVAGSEKMTLIKAENITQALDALFSAKR